MALERVRAGPAVAPPAGGEARRGRRAAGLERSRASGQRLLACKKTRPRQTFLRTNPDAPFEALLPQASSVADNGMTLAGHRTDPCRRQAASPTRGVTLAGHRTNLLRRQAAPPWRSNCFSQLGRRDTVSAQPRPSNIAACAQNLRPMPGRRRLKRCGRTRGDANANAPERRREEARFPAWTFALRRGLPHSDIFPASRPLRTAVHGISEIRPYSTAMPSRCKH